MFKQGVERLTRLSAKPLGLNIPGGRDHRACQKPFAGMGFKTLRFAAKRGQVLVTPFRGAGDKRRGARQPGVGELQLLLHVEGLRHPRYGVPGLRVAPGGEVAAKHRTAQADQTAFEQGTRLLARAFCLKTVAGIAPLQRVVHRRQIAHAAGKGPDMIQTRDKRMATGSRQAAKGGFQAINPAQGCRNANGAVGVGAERKMHQPGGHGGG